MISIIMHKPELRNHWKLNQFMNCKNCKTQLNPTDNFCHECGAKIIHERITIKSLFISLVNSLGWDNKFFLTLRYLFIKPHIVLNEYLEGTRKKYANPFAFFAICLAASLFVFSLNSEKLMQLTTNSASHKSEISTSEISAGTDNSNSKDFLGYKNQDEFTKAMLSFQMKYYNLVAFLLLPFYTLLAFLVFGKPCNFGEHLVINTYIQGILLVFNIVFFVFSILTGINVFVSATLILMFVYYFFVYQKLYKLRLGQLLIKILKFFGVILTFFIILIVIGAVFAMMNHAKSS